MTLNQQIRKLEMQRTKLEFDVEFDPSKQALLDEVEKKLYKKKEERSNLNTDTETYYL